jgi:hypothetical protein
VSALETGRLGGENVSMMFEIRGENFMMSWGGQSTKVKPDGTFTFRNVAPAEYHPNVRTAATADRPAEGPTRSCRSRAETWRY